MKPRESVKLNKRAKSAMPEPRDQHQSSSSELTGALATDILELKLV